MAETSLSVSVAPRLSDYPLSFYPFTLSCCTLTAEGSRNIFQKMPKEVDATSTVNTICDQDNLLSKDAFFSTLDFHCRLLPAIML